MGHWIFQVALLFSVIFLVVLRDSFKDQTNEDEVPPIAEKPLKAQTKDRSFSELSKNPPEKIQEKYAKASLSANPETTTEGATVTAATATTALKKNVTFRVALMSRKTIEDLMGNSQRLEENVLIVEAQRLFKAITQSQAKTIGLTMGVYQFNQEVSLFIGEEDSEENSSPGFYLQTTVFEESHPESIHFGIQSWYQFKTDESGPRKEWDVTMNNSSSLVIVHPEVHDIPFSKEDLQFFESSRKLKALGSEDFNEDSDIVFVVGVR